MITTAPRLRFRADGRWRILMADELGTDLEGWATETADWFGRRCAPFTEPGARSSLIDYYSGVGRIFLDSQASAAFALVPSDRDFGVDVMAQVDRIPAPGSQSDHGLMDLLRTLVPDPVDLVAPASIDSVQTEAGPMGLVRFRSADITTDGAQVIEGFFAVWWFPDVEAAIVVSTAFTNLVEAAGWAADLVEALTLTSRLEEEPGVDPAPSIGLRVEDLT